MRSSRERRSPHATALFPFEDCDHELVLAERRSWRERRMDNLDLEERQLLLSEMPSPTSRRTR